ncbi:MAG: adenylate cyclase [Hyphomicrobiales bacterium]|nr:adenylate cyclase [Hyphomicrobiales bacterium]
MPGPNHDTERPSSPTVEGMRVALQAVLKSQTFAASTRARKFLAFVAEETFAGKGDSIRAKTIGLDLYGYSAEDIEQRESVVRVDARRVRHKLEAYYRSEGKGAEIVVELPKGRYSPVFHQIPSGRQEAAESPQAVRSGSRALLPAVLVVIAGFGIGAIIWLSFLGAGGPATDSDQKFRQAVFEVSPQRLRAITLAQEGRDLIFPAVDAYRLDSARRIFGHATEEDSDYFGGYAGIAQIHSTIALLSDDPDKAAAAVEIARENAQTAFDLAPGEAWGLSAMAWLAFAEGNYDDAKLLSRRAVEAHPNDPYIMEFDSLISLYSGDFDRVIAEVERILGAISGEAGYVFQVASGAAQYHSGEYNLSIRALEESIASGAPTGPVTLAYLAAANYRAGYPDRARTHADRLTDVWPDQRIDLMFQKLFQDPAHGRQLAEDMRSAGWSPK